MNDGTRKPHLPKAARSKPGCRAIAGRSRSKREGIKRRLEQGALDLRPQQYVLRLYVTGATPASGRAIETVRSVCEELLQGRYELEVIDIYQMPELAKDHQIIATPTLIKVVPSPIRRFIGDLSKVEKVLFGLDLREKS